MRKIYYILLFVLSFYCSFGQSKESKKNQTGDLSPTCRGTLNEKGERTGIWEFYDGSRKTEFEYDYDRKSVIYVKNDTTNYFIFYNNSLIKTTLDKPPLFKEGSMYYSRQFAKNLKYPRFAARNGIEGKVALGLQIDTSGNLINTRIIEAVDTSCANEAIRVVKKIEGNWYPGFYRGMKVETEIVIRTKFKLE